MHYPVILADPPYRFRTRSPKGDGRSPRAHYLDMSIEEIAAYPVGDYAARDSALFLWIPVQHTFEMFKARGTRSSC